MASDPTWCIRFTLISPIYASDEHMELLGIDLIEAGALGTIVIPEGLGCYIAGTREVAVAFGAKFSPNIFQDFTLEEVQERNWVQDCRDLLEPVNAGKLKITPLLSAKEAPSTRHIDEIFIIPGLGFGTGHHETTKSALIMLQHERIQRAHPKTVLDVGTGSGILAIGAAKLYGAQTIAFDNDAAAIANAQENASLNNVDTISFGCGTIERWPGQFDLVLANIYAEILVELEDAFSQRLSTGNFLIISGIMKTRLGLIEGAFRNERWNFIEQIEENGWVTELYEKQ